MKEHPSINETPYRVDDDDDDDDGNDDGGGGIGIGLGGGGGSGVIKSMWSERQHTQCIPFYSPWSCSVLKRKKYEKKTK